MVADIYNLAGKAAIERMRKRFERDIDPNAPLGIRTTFVGGVRCKSTGAGENKLEFAAIATTDAVDEEKDVVVRDGCDWTTYFGKNGMTLFADHCYGVCYRIGYARDLPRKVDTPGGGKGWLLTGIVNRASSIPTVQAVVDGLEDGRIGMSIGFEALEWGDPTPEEQRKHLGVERMIRRCKILEVSATYMPCNVDCQTLSVSVDEEKAAEISTLAVKGLLPRRVMDHLILPRSVKAKTPAPEPRRKTIIFVDA